jgi:predicted GTPase
VTTTPVGYQAINERRRRLANVLTSLAQSCRKLDDGPRADELDKLRQRLETDAFKLMIAGEFKRGKSTLINAMLGADVLPAKVAPCTAVITRIRFGEDRRATLFFKDRVRAPLEIAAADLRKYVTIQDGDEEGDDEACQSVDRSPYAAAEVRYPLPLLRNNVEVVDSPGLNEHKTRSAVTKEYLTEADAMIVVLSCQQALSQSELQFIREDLKGRDLADTFFLWNHFDIIQDSPEDTEDIKARSRKYLEPLVGSKPRIFFISARTALQGRKAGQPAQITTSGLPRFEVTLEQFLSTERGRVKLRSPLTAAEYSVRDILLTVLPERENLLKRPMEELRQQYERQKPRLDAIEQQRERILHSIERRRDFVAQNVEAAYRNLISKLEAGLREQAAAQPVGMWETLWDTPKVKRRLAEHLEGWMREQVTGWKDSTLTPLLEQHIKAMDQDLNNQASKFLKDLESVRAAFNPSVPAQAEAGSEDITPISRVVGAVGGLVVGGIGSAMEGASLGTKQMAKGLGVNIAVCVGLLVAGVSLPMVVPVLAAVGVVRTLLAGKSKGEQIRQGLVGKLTEQLRASQRETEETLRAEISAIFGNIREKVAAGVKIKIHEVQGQVEAVVRKLKQHQGAAAQELATLRQIRQEIASQEQLLRKLRAEVESA